jgi:hypothetical protein
MASEVAFFRGDGGHWLTTSSRYSRKRISDLAGVLGSAITMTPDLSVRVRDTRAGPHICPGKSDKKTEV